MAEIIRQEARHADMQRRVRELRPLARESESPFIARVLENVLQEQSRLSSKINILLCDWRTLALQSIQGKYQTPNAQLSALHKMEAAQRTELTRLFAQAEPDNAEPRIVPFMATAEPAAKA